MDKHVDLTETRSRSKRSCGINQVVELNEGSPCLWRERHYFDGGSQVEFSRKRTYTCSSRFLAHWGGENTERGCCWMCMNTCNDVHSLDNLVKIAFTEPVRTQGTSKLLAGVNGPCLKSNAFII
jgi:hypothetical protein